MDHELGDFLTAVDRAQTVDHAWTATVRYLKTVGIEHVHYVYAPRRKPGGSSEVVLRRTTSPEWWLEHYKKSGFASVDPGIAHCARSSDPLLTGLDFAPPNAHPRQIAFHEESRALDIRNGVMIPLRLEQEDRFGAFACQTRFGRAELEHWFTVTGSSLELAVFYADAKFLSLRRKADAKEVNLSRRECECLLWLSKGLRNERIAERMGISNSTVEMHLTHARSKLGARTREQALAKAIALRLIVP